MWKKLLLTQFILAFSVIFADKVIALSVRDYCLSKVKPSKLKMELEKNPYKLPNEIRHIRTEKVIFSKNGKKYSIKIDNRIIQLVDEENNIIISQGELPYEKDSAISNAYLTKDNWLYVHATRNNYAVRVNPEAPQSYLEYEILPKIHSERCTRFSYWFEGYCRVDLFSIYPTSNKVFLQVINFNLMVENGWLWK